ncbi:SPOR domain-containing protein [Neisseria cinerea]|uniref:SPOR domain-containing protein n=1 Tax=Neisseria cinerea TaxID=483 RepID=UPI0028D85D16|nr:SPOR domain-containing protein [Neisseria cinerea]
MKWLFILLVAINIAVFGGTVGYKLTLKQAGRIPEAQNAANNLQVQPVAPTMPVVRNIPASGPAVQAASASDTGVLLGASDILTEEQAEQLRLKKEAEQKKLKEKKQREEKARREKLAAEKAREEHENGSSDTAVDARASCAAQASLTMDEDDYHRIKGLLGKWSHVASRSVEKRTAKRKPGGKTYRVVLPLSGNTEGQMAELSAQGFNAVPINGELSLGVSNSRQNAQMLQNRLAGAGFGGAHIVEHFAESDSQDESLSVSRMTVLFSGVNDEDAREIRKITSPYGSLNLRSCK